MSQALPLVAHPNLEKPSQGDGRRRVCLSPEGH